MKETPFIRSAGLFRFGLILTGVICLLATGIHNGPVAASDFFNPQIIIPDVFATGYFCVYNSELQGTQSISRAISGETYTLKPSFLFGGYGVAMQGTGKTAPDGDYIKYAGNGGSFVYITGRDAGRNLEGKWVINPQTLRSRYARLGVTDFTGFGNLALSRPGRAKYLKVSSIFGFDGRELVSRCSIAVDPKLIPLGRTGTIVFKNYEEADSSVRTQQITVEELIELKAAVTFRADDTGPAIKGKRIDIYLGEGQAVWDQWLQSGGNRYVDIHLTR